MTAAADVWTRYWSGSGAKPGAGCLPNAAGPVEAAQKRVWQDFARRLPRGARVLDLATGNGVVLHWMAAVRRDLKLVGVDSAAALPPAPKGILLKAGVALEKLPFAEASFDAATSQFGFEYGEAGAAAAEIGRALRRGGSLLMLVHSRESEIVAHNRSRAEALRWARDRYLARAAAFAAAGGGLPVPPLFRGAPAEAQREFPHQPAAGEFALGLLQRLDAGRVRGPDQARALVRSIGEEAEGELARIALLERAARDEAGVAEIARALAAAGLSVEAPGVLPDPQSRRPLAWLVSARR